jgi:hypothetical protein
VTGAHGPAPVDFVVGLGDLLHAYGCDDIDELSAVVDGDSEPDLWVAEIPGGVEIGSGTWATGLEFPFTVGDFWALTDEVERRETVRIETIGF